MEPIRTPFDKVADIVTAVDSGLSTGAAGTIQDQRRQVAAKWLADLVRALNDFHRRLLKMLDGHPALRDSKSPEEYRRYLNELGSFEERLYQRDVKGEISSNLRKLQARLKVDFDWLRKTNEQSYDWLRSATAAAYQSEHGVIEEAKDLLSRLTGTYGSLTQRANDPSFVKEQIDRRAASAALIDAYKANAGASIARLVLISEEADIRFVPIEFLDARAKERLAERAVAAQEQRAESDLALAAALKATPQQTHQDFYTKTAVTLGALFLLLLIVIAIFIPNPTVFQMRVFLTALALAGGGFASTISGLLSTQINLAGQLTVGATGALAVIILIYFYNPAVLTGGP
jgi:hypothetical protein